MTLGPGVGHEEVGTTVGAEVLRRDPHARAAVGDSPGAPCLHEVEAERAAGDVQVQPVRVEVVRDVEVGPPVAVQVSEDGAEAVVDVCSLDARL